MNVVEGIGSLEALVSGMVHNRGGERVKAQEISQLPTRALKDKGKQQQVSASLNKHSANADL